MCPVKAKITTYTEQGYTLKFSLPSSYTLSVAFKIACQRLFSRFNIRTVTAAEFCSTLPGFRHEDEKICFIQQGTLSWVGEGSTIDKKVLPLQTAPRSN